MGLFKEPVFYISNAGNKIYPITVDIKKGVTKADMINFMSADNKSGILSINLVDGGEDYFLSNSTAICSIIRPDYTQLELPCSIITDNILEVDLGVNGTYQVGLHIFDIKLYTGGKTVATPQMTYIVNESILSDNVIEGDDRLPIFTTLMGTLNDLTTRVEDAITANTQDLEVKLARQSMTGVSYETLGARLDAMEINPYILFEGVEG